MQNLFWQAADIVRFSTQSPEQEILLRATASLLVTVIIFLGIQLIVIRLLVLKISGSFC